MIQETPQTGTFNVEKTSMSKSKRDIFRFAGEKPTAINLEHVSQISVEGKRITFQFHNSAMYIDLEDDAGALRVFEILLNTWAADIA